MSIISLLNEVEGDIVDSKISYLYLYSSAAFLNLNLSIPISDTNAV